MKVLCWIALLLGTLACQSTAPALRPPTPTAMGQWESLDAQGTALALNFLAEGPQVGDAQACAAIAAQATLLVELNLARTSIGVATLERCAQLPRLERLDLSCVVLPPGALAVLQGHAQLSQVLLVGAALSEPDWQALESLPQLRSVYLHQAQFDVPRLEAAQRARPQVRWVVDAPLADAIETEAQPVVGRTAPASSSQRCPVTGAEIDVATLLEFEGRQLYFCCTKCRASFQADPERYRANLP